MLHRGCRATVMARQQKRRRAMNIKKKKRIREKEFKRNRRICSAGRCETTIYKEGPNKEYHFVKTKKED